MSLVGACPAAGLFATRSKKIIPMVIHPSGMSGASEKPGYSLEPIFIVGVPRSGTTLLVNLMGKHPRLAPIYETRFLRNLLFLCDRICWFYGDSFSRKSAGLFGESIVRSKLRAECDRFKQKAIAYNQLHSRDLGNTQVQKSFPFGAYCIHYGLQDVIRETDIWLEAVMQGPLDCEMVWRTARAYIEQLFKIHCSNMGKPGWINKTPGLLNVLDSLSKLYPEARYIHILRDGRDVALSNIALSWAPSVKVAARRWKQSILRGRKSVRTKHLKYAEFRYEELVESPHEVISRAFEFLDLNGDVEKVVSSMSVSRESRGAWRTAFTAQDRKIFAQEAGDLLMELGYEKDDTWVR